MPEEKKRRRDEGYSFGRIVSDFRRDSRVSTLESFYRGVPDRINHRTFVFLHAHPSICSGSDISERSIESMLELMRKDELIRLLLTL